MAKPKSDKTSLERALRIVVEETIERHLSRISRGRPFGDELKEVRGTVARIERRLEALGHKVGASPRRPRAAGTGSPGRPPLHVGCKVEGCDAEHYALGLCSKHYQQARRGRLTSSRRRPGDKAAAKGRRGRLRKGKARGARRAAAHA